MTVLKLTDQLVISTMERSAALKNPDTDVLEVSMAYVRIIDKLLKMARMPDEPDPKALKLIESIVASWDNKTASQIAYEVHQALVRYYKTGETPNAPLTDEERQTVYDWVDKHADMVIETADIYDKKTVDAWRLLKRLIDEQRAAAEERS